MFGKRETAEEMARWTKGTGSCQILDHPAADRREKAAWTRARPNGLTWRMLGYVASYLRIAEENGCPAYSTGIPMDDGGYFVADKGVMNAAMNTRLIDLVDGSFDLIR